MEHNREQTTEELLDQTKEHIIVYPIPEQISKQLSNQAEQEAHKSQSNGEEHQEACAAESRSDYQKWKRKEEKKRRQKGRSLWLLCACVFVIAAGVLCGAAIATTINTPRDTVEIASANAQYVKDTVTDAVSSLVERLPWNEDESTNNDDINNDVKKDAEDSVKLDQPDDLSVPSSEDNLNDNSAAEPNEEQNSEVSDVPVITEPVTTGEIDPTKPMIALTFDDGPSQYTWSIVSTLSQYNAKGTFFLVGNRIATHKSAIDFTIANGNQIASHGFSHLNLVKLTDEETLEQIQKVDSLLLQQHNYTATLFRVPYGERDNRVLNILKEQGKPVIGWSVDPRDWEVQDKDEIVKHVLRKAKDGDIILMHDLYKPTADAVAELVPALQAKGYQLVTVSELFQYKGISLEPGKYYRSEKER